MYLFLVFIYTCPGYSCPVKERMLYSSCKGPVTDVCEQQFGITIDKKVLVMLAKHMSVQCKQTHSCLVCGILFQELLIVTSNVIPRFQFLGFRFCKSS